MSSYNTMFAEDVFGEEIIGETKKLMSKVWRGKTEDRVDACQKYSDNVCAILGIDNPPEVIFVGGEMGDIHYSWTGGGSYNKQDNTISLYKKVSFVTMLHEVRHKIQHYEGMLDNLNTIDRELDAIGWSHSLYYICDPARYNRAIRNGLLKHSR